MISEETDPNTNNIFNDSRREDVDTDNKIFDETEEEETKQAKVPPLIDKKLFNNEPMKSLVDEPVPNETNSVPQILQEEKQAP